jgi:hypothetical protein
MGEEKGAKKNINNACLNVEDSRSYVIAPLGGLSSKKMLR